MLLPVDPCMRRNYLTGCLPPTADFVSALAGAAARLDPMTTPDWSEPQATAVLVLADGTVIEGMGLGATGKASGEVCFNTSMTGYQEILTDPSYAGQIVTFTFPH